MQEERNYLQQTVLKKKTGPYASLPIEIDSKCIKDLNVKCET